MTKKTTKILFVCHGNICRSPMAEFVMKYLVDEAAKNSDEIARNYTFEIASAAVSTEETGNDIYPPAKRTLRDHGIPFTRHSARQITRADYDYYDYIICADASNLRWLDRLIGSDTSHKISLLMQWTDGQLVDGRLINDKYVNISDPWYTGDFETAYLDIWKGCNALLRRIIA